MPLESLTRHDPRVP